MVAAALLCLGGGCGKSARSGSAVERPRVEPWPSPLAADASSSALGSLLPTSAEGSVWLETPRGLGRYDPRAGEFELVLGPKQIEEAKIGPLQGVYEDPSGPLWLWSASAAHRYDPIKRSFHTYETHVRPRAMARDRRGALWLGTEEGAFQFREESGSFQRIGDLLNVNALHEDRRGTLWCVTYGGIYRYDAQRRIFENLASDVTLSEPLYPASIYEHTEGALWFGTNDGALRYSPQDKSTELLAIQGIPPNIFYGGWVRSIRSDSAGGLWFGAGTGLSRYDISKKAFRGFTSLDGVADNVEDLQTHHASGSIWVSSPAGLVRLVLEDKLREDGSLSSVLRFRPRLAAIGDHVAWNAPSGISRSPPRLPRATHPPRQTAHRPPQRRPPSPQGRKAQSGSGPISSGSRSKGPTERGGSRAETGCLHLTSPASRRYPPPKGRRSGSVRAPAPRSSKPPTPA